MSASAWLARSIERAMALDQLQALAAQLPADRDAAGYAAAALQWLGVQYRLPERGAEAVPAAGGVVIVANHPYGGIDGLIAFALLQARRPDLKVLAHGMLKQLAPLAPHILPVDPFGTRVAARANAASVRAAVEHVRAGGALLLFPAGEVAHLRWGRLAVSDPLWSATAARLICKLAVPVVPMHFSGRNSAGFQLAGLVHPRLRTLLLPREILNKRGMQVEVRFGAPLGAQKLHGFETPEALATALRMQTCALAGDAAAKTPAVPAQSGAALAEAVPAELLQAEIARLAPAQCLAQSGELAVWLARAAQIPQTLREIGRLRELTFRAVGEGTGRSLDLDEFDAHYEHLFVWHAGQRQIVGAYRLGRIDVIRRSHGVRGLYLATLFDFREPFFALLGPALELGRSFVRPEFQRGYAPLLLLWKGIGAFIGRHPRYARLIGPASVSADYDELSRALLVQCLRRRLHDPLLGALVKPRQPFTNTHSLRSLVGEVTRCSDVEQVGRLIAHREPDGKGIPVLLRQYLRLGARTIGFNVDAAFGNSLDCLILLDLRRTPEEVLRRYLSPDAIANLRDYWREQRLVRA